MRQVFLIISLLIILPVMSSCTCGSKISAEEAIAIVEIYERDKSVRRVGGEWDANYKGKGHWRVTSYVKDKFYNLYSWDYYEDSGIVEYKGVQHK